MTDEQVLKALWRGAAVPTTIVGAIAVAAFGARDGVDGAVGALLGCLVVLGFFGLSLLVMKWTARTDPMNAFGGALLSYAIKIVALAGVLLVFRDTTLFDPQAFGLTILACAGVWLIFEVRAFLRAQIPTIQPEKSDRPGSEPGL
jgi:ATP synthase protein I